MSAALAFLTRTRTSSGGWGFGPGGANSQSTALAVLGLRAWNGSAASRGSEWFDGARGPGGWIRFQQGGASQTPVWVTAQALLAMSGRTLPLPLPAGAAVNAKRNASAAVSVAPATHSEPAAVRAAGRTTTAVKSTDLQFSMRVAETVGRVAAVFAKSFAGADR